MKKGKKNEKFTNEITTGDDLYIKPIDTDIPVASVSVESENNVQTTETQKEVETGGKTEITEIPQSFNGSEIDKKEPPKVETNPEPEPEPNPEPVPEKKKKTRGRPKKTESKQESKKDLLDLLPDKEPEPVPSVAPPEAQTKKFEVGKYISGSLVLLLIDSVVPGLLLLGAKKAGVSGLENVNVSDIALDSHEKRELEPLAHEAVKEIMADISPGAAFLVAISVIYGGKLMLNRETE